MEIKKALSSAIKDSGFTQERLAKALGYKSQSGVAERIRGNISIETLVSMMDAIGYEVTVQKKKPGRRTAGQYVLGGENGDDEE